MKKRISLLILIICMVGGIGFFFPKKNTQEVKMVKKKQTPEISFYHQEYKERYDTYQKAHQALSKKEVITLVNMNRDFDFYGKIIKQEHPNDLNTIVNKYYQLDETYEPSDLVEINTNAGTYGSSYSKHTARKVVYDDFQALKQACINKGFELYVTSGYRSTVWQKEIYNHMVETYSVERADETCSRPGHSEHTTGLGLDIALDQYKYEEVENHPQYSWFLSQLSNYGFILRYPKDKEELTGYSYEAWHIRYVGKDLAQKIEKSGLTFDEYYARNYQKIAKLSSMFPIFSYRNFRIAFIPRHLMSFKITNDVFIRISNRYKEFSFTCFSIISFKHFIFTSIGSF